MDQPPAVAFTAFADAWRRAIEMEIGAALCVIGRGKGFFEYQTAKNLKKLYNYMERQTTRNSKYVHSRKPLQHVKISNFSSFLNYYPNVFSCFNVYKFYQGPRVSVFLD